MLSPAGACSKSVCFRRLRPSAVDCGFNRWKVVGKDTETVINALIKTARKLPEELYKSLTWDRGSVRRSLTASAFS